MSAELRAATSSGKTLYAHVLNASAYRWNGSAFEAYSAGNYSAYDIALTEQGSSGVYVGDFPSAITSSGTFDYFVFNQAGGSPAEGDKIVNAGRVDWTGSSSASASTGSMTASAWRTYLLGLGFKRTDKDTELYEATTDAIQEMRRRFMFDEAEAESTTTDTISTLGDFKLTLESDFGMLLGIILEDGDTGTALEQVTKAQFDQMYPSVNVESDRGYPRHFCVYNGQIYIGPIPDSTGYSYRISYSKRGGTISSTTTSVPFTSLYRDVLANLTLSRLWRVMDEYERAEYYEGKFEKGFSDAMRRERFNSGEHFFQVRPLDV